MQPAIKKQYSVIFLTSILILNGCSSPPISADKKPETDIMSNSAMELKESMVQPSKPKFEHFAKTMAMQETSITSQPAISGLKRVAPYIFPPPVPSKFNRESYDYTPENSFISTLNDPLSTFSIDVDTASYANIRRFIQSGHLPPVHGS